MNVNDDLLGKTITGVIAHRHRETGLREIWVLQFADGSHVEFVSPGGRKSLRLAASQGRKHTSSQGARDATRDAASPPVKITDGRSRRFPREAKRGAQLTLNVA
jgi:hypothetical protein